MATRNTTIGWMGAESYKSSLVQLGLAIGLYGVAMLLAVFPLATNQLIAAVLPNSLQQAILVSAQAGAGTFTTQTLNTSSDSQQAGYRAPPGNVFMRIRPLDTQGCNSCSGNAVWALPGYYAENVIALINQVRPSALERYTSGPLNATMLVPTAPGDPTMDVSQFMNASTAACNCYAIPRINLSIGIANVLIQANALYHFPMKPKMKYLSLDQWKAFVVNNSAANITSMFTQLYAQGWKGIGINGCADEIKNASPYASFVDVCVNTATWLPNPVLLKTAQSQDSIKKIILYIDFPIQMQKFSNLSTDQEAAALNGLAALQSIDKYKLDYNMLQVITFNTIQNGTMWDTSQRFTNASGIWHGESLTSVIKQLVGKYNS